MHKRGARWPCLLLTSVALTVELVAAGLARGVGNIGFAKVMFARIEIVAAKRAEENQLSSID